MIAGEPHYKIIRIITEECRVFRTKARAPSMVVCEVMRDDVYQQYRSSFISRAGHNSSKRELGTEEDMNHDYRYQHHRDHEHSVREKASSSEVSVDHKKNAKPLVQKASGPNKTGTHNIVKAAPHSVLHSRVRGDSIDGHMGTTTSVSGNIQHVHNNEGVEAGSKHTFESISQSIRDVDSLLVDSSYHSAMIAELQKVDNAKSSDNTHHQIHASHSSPPSKISSSMNSSSSSSKDGNMGINNLDMQLQGTTFDSPSASSREPHLSTSNTPDNQGLRRNSASFHLPKWRRNSSFLPANRLSTSTEGILRSSQVSQITNNNGSESMTASSSTSTSVVVRRSSEVMISTGSFSNTTNNQQRSSARLSTATTNKLHASLIKSVSSPNISAQLAAEVEAEQMKSNDYGSESLRVADMEKNGNTSHHHLDGAHGGLPNQQQVMSSAQRLLSQGLIDQREYEQLIRSDRQFRDETARDEALITKSRVENAFGETFQSKKDRILNDRKRWLRQEGLVNNDENNGKTSLLMEDESWPIFDLRCFIVKTNDDLRQEICCLQLMKVCKEIFDYFGLHDMLFLKPYRIISTGNNSGIVEVLPDAISLDALKHSNGFTNLKDYFNTTYNTSKERLHRAKRNFMKSLAAYSLFSYILLIKDRHNGNLLIDAEGHILHIDFGFMLSIAPGGSFSIETAPFKLTDEMVDLLGGLDSPLFGDFVTAFTKGFIALQANCENILSAITILSQNSTFPCFQGKATQQILEKLRSRFRSELNVNDAVKHCLDLITNSYGHYGTKQYDTFQYYTNGILP
jgi:phosphatidylinositol 4-kinase